MVLIAVAIIPFLLAIVLPLLRLRASALGVLNGAAMLILFLAALSVLPTLTESGAQTLSLPWMPEIGLTLTLYADGLALLFVLLITGIGAAVMFYAGYYFDDGRKAGRFLALLLAFTGSMLALVLAGNVLTLFIAWELTSITSFLLIGFYGKDPAARRGASQALMITGGGGLALLVGLLVLGSAAGSLEMADILANGDVLRAHPWYGGFVVLILIGCFSKSAQFPLHFWLPGAMSAPTPASSFLHSATMVKAGVYLLARLSPALGDTPLWETALVGFGLTTMLIGAALSLPQRDLKAMLAYSTVSMLGAMVALIGLPHGDGLKAAYVTILAHGLYKCTLFLVAGAVDHATGTRDIGKLGGLRRQMPGFALVTAVVALSMAGVPPLFGFVSKELLIVAMEFAPLALAVVVTSAALTVALALRLFWDVFVRQPAPDHDAEHGDHFHALPPLMVAGPGALAALSIIAGIGISPLITPLVEPAVGKPISLYLIPPEGINLAFVLSMVALALGALIFLTRGWWLRARVPLPSASAVYEGILGAVSSFGDLLLRSQGGRIRYYLLVILAAVIILVTVAMAQTLPFSVPGIALADAADALKAVLLLLSLVTTGASIIFKRHLLAALSLGVAGYSIGGIFLLEPAPDVALVQFLVETLATVLIILILARTSPQERQRAMDSLWGQSRGGLVRDLVIASALGVVVTIFALESVSTRPTLNPIANWHLANALPQVGVNDVVASIVTDFRGTDTLIEITVFGMASLGVLTLLARPSPGKKVRLVLRQRSLKMVELHHDNEGEPEQPILYRSRFSDPITQLAALLVLPFSFVIALAHIAYAGVAPGDGFTAGVIIGLGIALWFVVFGYQETRARLPWLHPARLVGSGILIALINALLPVAFGREFLAFTEVTGISIADIKIASTMMFEIGICLAVFGGVSTIMEAISHPKECEPL